MGRKTLYDVITSWNVRNILRVEFDNALDEVITGHECFYVFPVSYGFAEQQDQRAYCKLYWLGRRLERSDLTKMLFFDLLHS